MDYTGTVFILVIFITYLTLWGIKRIKMKKNAKVEVNVMNMSSSALQTYMLHLSRFLMLYVCACIVFHFMNIRAGILFERLPALNTSAGDYTGFLVSPGGLALCCYAQIKMGASWRVGIDENRSTELVTTGLYRYIRNPAYLGLMIMCAGIFLIWPTPAISLFVCLFFLFLEIQTRCEEDFLIQQHGNVYTVYKQKTKRYIPFIY